jgi:hypothetical protein
MSVQRLRQRIQPLSFFQPIFIQFQQCAALIQRRCKRLITPHHLRFFLAAFFLTFFRAGFLALLVVVFFAAFGPIPTQPSTVSTTFLTLLFFFAMTHSSVCESGYYEKKRLRQ